MSKKFSIRDFCFIGVFAAIIAALTLVSIPMPNGVAMTLQTFAIALAGIVLGAKKGTIATIVYILLGAVGLPIFSGFRGGLSVLVGPTGGFILSFPIIAVLSGIGSKTNKIIPLYVGIVSGALINYLCGILMFMVVTSANLYGALAACVIPFIITDSIKIIMAGLLGKQIKAALEKAGMLTSE